MNSKITGYRGEGMGCIEYIQSDLYRYAGNKSLKSFMRYYIFSEGFKFTVWLRICSFLRRKRILKYTIFPFAVLVYRHYRVKYGFDIPYSIEIGPGLILFHISSIVISAKKIGRNATISHSTTIGMRIKNGKAEFPEIGNNVYLAPGSKIIGGITVENNVALGTNAVLTNSVQDNAVVVGIPGRVISEKGSGSYIVNPLLNE